MINQGKLIEKFGLIEKEKDSCANTLLNFPNDDEFNKYKKLHYMLNTLHQMIYIQDEKGVEFMTNDLAERFCNNDYSDQAQALAAKEIVRIVAGCSPLEYLMNK